jgi:hypothetical protein
MARSPKPPKSSKSSKQVDALKHDAASRRNIPTAEMESFFRRDEDASPMPPKHYPRARSLAEGATHTSEEPRAPELIWNGARISITDEQMKQLAETGKLTLSDVQLVWRGKDKQDWSDLVVNVPPLYIQEKIHPKAIIDDLKRRTAEKRDDGARSFVRHALAIDFVGHPARHTMTLADVALDAPPEKPVHTLVNEAGGLVLAPRGDGVHHRIGVIDASSPYLAPSEPVSLAEVAACAARIFGRDLRPRDPVWISRFTDESRLAECYRKGRIFLAGDAAHINPPMGGQGMNVGIQDAMNLGWKLASVIHGTASDEILDSYQSERRPVGEALQQDTLVQFALFSAFDPPALALRRMLSGFLRVPEVNRQLSDQLSGFGVAYPEPLFQAEHNWEHRKGVSGHRLSDGDLVLRDGSRTTLYPYLQEGRWVLLQVAAESNAMPVRGAINIVSLAPGANDGLFGKFASMLVRPDGYLAHVRAVDDAGSTEFAA